MIECDVCPLLYEIRDAEQWLYGDGTLTDKVYSARPCILARTRIATRSSAVFDRIKAVLAAWEKPAQTIEKILADNAKLIDDAEKILGNRPGQARLRRLPEACPDCTWRSRREGRVDRRRSHGIHRVLLRATPADRTTAAAPTSASGASASADRAAALPRRSQRLLRAHLLPRQEALRAGQGRAGRSGSRARRRQMRRSSALKPTLTQKRASIDGRLQGQRRQPDRLRAIQAKGNGDG